MKKKQKEWHPATKPFKFPLSKCRYPYILRTSEQRFYAVVQFHYVIMHTFLYQSPNF